MRSRLIGLALAALTVLTLTACAPSTPPGPSTSAPATTAAPSPTPTPTPTLEPAVVSFDGDCAKALSDEEVADALGEPAQLFVRDPATFGHGSSNLMPAATSGIGGLSCTWRGETDSRTVTISVVLLSTVAQETVDAAHPMVCEGGGGAPMECTVALAVGDTWLIVDADAESVVNAVLAPVGSRLADQHPQPATMPEDAWGVPDCSTLQPAIESATGASGWTPGIQSDNLPRGPLWDILTADAVISLCGFYSQPEVGGVTVEIQPGYAVSELATVVGDGVDVAGASDARTFTTDGPRVLIATVGSNTLLLRGYGAVENALPAIAAALIPLMPARAPASV